VAAVLGALALLAAPAAPAQADAASGPVVVVELDTAVDKVSARFLARAIEEAVDEGAPLVVVRLDTPGGLLTATRDMVGEILDSPVPVAVYVGPSGAQAASAGTFIAASAGVLAMAPATNIGAAAVVGGQGEDLPQTLRRKAQQDAAAFMRSIAERRGRPESALAETVLKARSYSGEEALELGIADLVAADVPDVLAQLDGRAVEAAGGTTTVRTAGVPIHRVEMNLFEQVLSFLADPNVAFLLISLGTLALVIELYSPGLWFPGTAGVISLVLGFAAIGNLPFSWASLALFAVAIALFVGEALHPGIGLLGAVGTVALVLAGLFLVGFSGTPELPGSSANVSTWLLVGIGGLLGLATVWLAVEFRRSRRSPAYTSPVAASALVGQLAEVSSRLAPAGEVRLAGEYWSAELEEPDVAEAGELVRVTQARDLRLVVRRLTLAERTEQTGLGPPSVTRAGT
jgi:membrane-bound serine protease (ClpP class)